MKKVLCIVLFVLISVSNVNAMPRGHHKPHHRVVHGPIISIKKHYNNGWESFFAGLIGSTIGSYIVANQYKHPLSNDVRCVVMKSRNSGKIVKKCVDLEKFGYSYKQEIYDILFVE